MFDWPTRFLRPRLGTLVHHPPKPLTLPVAYGRLPRNISWPRLSIVTPCFNAAPFIERTIDSILSQRYPNLEYLIQDGGSTDGTMACIERFRPALSRCTSEPDTGQTDALNRGFGHTSGDIMAYLNADDLLLTGSLHYVALFFAEHPEVDALYGHRVLIDGEDREIGRWVLPPHDSSVLSWADYVPQETLFWRRRVWEAVGSRFDETFRFAMDWDLLVRLRDAGARFRRVPRFLGAFRVHSRQKTSDQLASIGTEEMDRIRTRIHGGPVSQAAIHRETRGYVRRHLLCDRLYGAGLLRY